MKKLYHYHSGHGCGCKKVTCKICTPSCTSGVYGKDVFYANDNLRRFFVSCGENYDSIIEKAFKFTDEIKQRVIELEELNPAGLNISDLKTQINNLQTIVNDLQSAKPEGYDELVAKVNSNYDAITTGSNNLSALRNAISNLQATVSNIQSSLDALDSRVGDLSDLNPGISNRSSLVGAINKVFEIASNGSSINGEIINLQNSISTLESKIGTGSLTTTNNTNLIAAINEVNSKATANTTEISNINNKLGNLSDLTPTAGISPAATTFVEAISDRQPIWQKGDSITVGSSQPAPFNNLENAFNEIKKYHFDKGVLTINLENGTYNLTKDLIIDKSLPKLTIKNISNNTANTTINTKSFRIIFTEQSNTVIKYITFISENLDFSSDNSLFSANTMSNVVFENISVTTPTSPAFSYEVFLSTNNSNIIVNNSSITTGQDFSKNKDLFVATKSGTIEINDVTAYNFTLGLYAFNYGSIYSTNLNVTNFQGYAKALEGSFIKIKGNNTFDSSQNPTGFENTVNGYGIFAFTLSKVIINNIRIKQLTPMTNIQYSNSTGIINWSGTLGIYAATNSNIFVNTCYLENFDKALFVHRGSIITSYTSKYITAVPVLGEMGAIYWGGQPGNLNTNLFIKASSATNQLNVGFLRTPFSYNNDSVTFSGWIDSAPIIV